MHWVSTSSNCVFQDRDAGTQHVDQGILRRGPQGAAGQPLTTLGKAVRTVGSWSMLIHVDVVKMFIWPTCLSIFDQHGFWINIFYAYLLITLLIHVDLIWFNFCYLNPVPKVLRKYLPRTIQHPLFAPLPEVPQRDHTKMPKNGFHLVHKKKSLAKTGHADVTESETWSPSGCWRLTQLTKLQRLNLTSKPWKKNQTTASICRKYSKIHNIS